MCRALCVQLYEALHSVESLFGTCYREALSLHYDPHDGNCRNYEIFVSKSKGLTKIYLNLKILTKKPFMRLW